MVIFLLIIVHLFLPKFRTYRYNNERESICGQREIITNLYMKEKKIIMSEDKVFEQEISSDDLGMVDCSKAWR